MKNHKKIIGYLYYFFKIAYPKVNRLVLMLSGCFVCLSCINDDGDDLRCESVAINKASFTGAHVDDFEFVDIVVNGDCMEITIRYGGGCGTTQHNLIDSEAIIDSYPPQRNIKLAFKDNDPCEAMVSKILYYDIRPIRVDGTSTIHLNVMDWSEPVRYEY